MKRILVFVIGLTGILRADGQSQTVVFKPEPGYGQDSYIWKIENKCVPTGYAITPEDMNFGDATLLRNMVWTYGAQGCGDGYLQALIKFTDLNSLPQNITIQNAKLKIYTPPYEPLNSYYGWGGNFGVGSSYGQENSVRVHRIKPGQMYSWNDSTVTWSTFYSNGTPFITANYATASDLSIKYDVETIIDVTQLIQDIVDELINNPDGNNGLLIKLATENMYSSRDWASSEYPNKMYVPELKVEYKINNSSSLNHQQNDIDAFKINILPNPTSGNWNLNFNLKKPSNIEVNIFDITGKLVKKTRLNNLNSGVQNVLLNGSDLVNGVYFLEIFGSDFSARKRLIKL